MGNYIKKASIHPLNDIPDAPDVTDSEPVTIGSLSLKEQIEKMELNSNIAQVKPLEVYYSPVETMEISVEKIKPKKFTFDVEELTLSKLPHTPRNSPVPSPRFSHSDSESDSESLEPSPVPLEPSPVPLEPSPTINDIISSRFWRVKEDFEETHKIIYDMMKELML
jgi:hypothetical protein